MSEIFSRRSFLKLSGALVAASALAACSDGGGGNGGSGGGSGGGGGIGSDTADFGDLKVQALSSGGYTGTQLYVTLAFTNETTTTDITFTTSDFTGIQINNKQLTSATRLKEVNSQSSSDTFPVKPNTTSRVNIYFDNTTSIDSSTTYNITFTFNHGGKKAVWSGSYKNFIGVNCKKFALQS